MSPVHPVHPVHPVQQERRKTTRREDDCALSCTELDDLHARVLNIETAISDLNSVKTDVHEIKELLTQGKGAIRLIQLLFYVVGPLVLAGYWIKEHLK